MMFDAEDAGNKKYLRYIRNLLLVSGINILYVVSLNPYKDIVILGLLSFLTLEWRLEANRDK